MKEQLYQVGDIVMINPNGELTRANAPNQDYVDALERGFQLRVMKYTNHHTYPYECQCVDRPSRTFALKNEELMPGLNQDEQLLDKLLKGDIK